ncbi:hypothetical protein BDN72DRAFT_866026 [Pluteus cervinus]|uniref:Uncharacterized protein n=1 Tax=Pluteus cervinus TaxID=181527 RepID=A0ACD3A0B6_9AGAR|nr:hypothetical protein BDN72DRAFT_866026 [Pluteus cervinus]
MDGSEDRKKELGEGDMELSLAEERRVQHWTQVGTNVGRLRVTQHSCASLPPSRIHPQLLNPSINASSTAAAMYNNVAQTIAANRHPSDDARTALFQPSVQLTLIENAVLTGPVWTSFEREASGTDLAPKPPSNIAPRPGPLLEERLRRQTLSSFLAFKLTNSLATNLPVTFPPPTMSSKALTPSNNDLESLMTDQRKPRPPPSYSSTWFKMDIRSHLGYRGMDDGSEKHHRGLE